MLNDLLRFFFPNEPDTHEGFIRRLTSVIELFYKTTDESTGNDLFISNLRSVLLDNFPSISFENLIDENGRLDEGLITRLNSSEIEGAFFDTIQNPRLLNDWVLSFLNNIIVTRKGRITVDVAKLVDIAVDYKTVIPQLCDTKERIIKNIRDIDRARNKKNKESEFKGELVEGLLNIKETKNPKDKLKQKEKIEKIIKEGYHDDSYMFSVLLKYYFSKLYKESNSKEERSAAYVFFEILSRRCTNQQLQALGGAFNFPESREAEAASRMLDLNGSYSPMYAKLMFMIQIKTYYLDSFDNIVSKIIGVLTTNDRYVLGEVVNDVKLSVTNIERKEESIDAEDGGEGEELSIIYEEFISFLDRNQTRAATSDPLNEEVMERVERELPSETHSEFNSIVVRYFSGNISIGRFAGLLNEFFKKIEKGKEVMMKLMNPSKS